MRRTPNGIRTRAATLRGFGGPPLGSAAVAKALVRASRAPPWSAPVAPDRWKGEAEGWARAPDVGRLTHRHPLWNIGVADILRGMADLSPIRATRPSADVHRGRPTAPEHRERGLALMAQWAAEDQAAGRAAGAERQVAR